MAPKYKLIYFNCKALGEPARFLFHFGGIEFEDFRFEDEEWPELKPKMPFGRTPVLEVDGKRIHQSAAICRYLAKLVGLAGSDEWEASQIDAFVDTVTDFRLQILDYHYETNPEIKDKKKGPLVKEIVPFYMSKFEELANQNGGHIVNGKLTWADIYFVPILQYLNDMVGKDIAEDCPTLNALCKTVLGLSGIKDWVAKRPVTRY